MLPTIDTGNLLKSTFDFLPELILCVGIVGLLFCRLFKLFDRTHLGGFALLITLMALLASTLQWLGASGLSEVLSSVGLDPRSGVGLAIQERALNSPDAASATLLFGDRSGGLLVFDYFTVFVRLFLYSFTALVIWLSLLTGVPDRDDSADFYTLLLGAVIGMALMASSVHLLMIFIAIEMASLPSYALAGFLKGKRQASEAALKYVVYGGGASGVMLYGMSLLAGKFGTGFLPDVAAGILATFQPVGEGLSFDPVVVLGTLFVFIGIAFKLSLVPFHFWCPDVFEGASAQVAGFLSVASKGAALALLARFTLILGGLDPLLGSGDLVRDLRFGNMIHLLVPTLACFAAVTTTFGNLAAYMQTNLKRLLAYSTIAHAGYMLMGLCTLTRPGVEAMLFYLIAYLFTNLGAFAIVGFLWKQTGSEDLNDFRGLIRRSPVMVVTLCFFLLSLLGIPPLVGFAAKFQIFAALYNEGQAYTRAGEPGLGATLYGLLFVGGLNTVLSAFFYLKVMRVMILETRPEDIEGVEPTPIAEPVFIRFYASLLALAVLVLGLFWGPLDRWSRQGTSRFRLKPGEDLVDTTVPPGMGGPPVMGGPPGQVGPPGKRP